MPEFSDTTLDLFGDHECPADAAVQSQHRGCAEESPTPNEFHKLAEPLTSRDRRISSAPAPGETAGVRTTETNTSVAGPAAPTALDPGARVVIENVPVGLIGRADHDPRQMVRDAAHHALVESLRDRGQDRTVSVYPMEEGRYRVRSGTRLWFAALDAGLQVLRVEIHPPLSRLDDLRRIAREENCERPKGAYERAVLAGTTRAALEENLGRTATIREVAPELGLQVGATCERLRIYTQITQEVIERSQVTLENLVAVSHTALHRAATKTSVDERAAWLFRAVHRSMPPWWCQPEDPPARDLTLIEREDGSIRVDSPAPDELETDQVVAVLDVLTRFVGQLQRRAGAPVPGASAV